MCIIIIIAIITQASYLKSASPAAYGFLFQYNNN